MMKHTERATDRSEHWPEPKSTAVTGVLPLALSGPVDERMSPIDRLAELRMFHGCTQRELEAVDSLSTVVRAETGRVLCHEGAMGREFFVIVNGSVTVDLPSGASLRLGPGEGFGEMAIVQRGRRVASVTANQPTELLVFSCAEFASLLERVPRVVRELLCAAIARLHDVEVRREGVKPVRRTFDVSPPAA